MTTAARVMAVIGRATWKPVAPEMRLEADLGMDSLDRMELCIGLEVAFNIQIDDAEQERWHTVADVIQCVSSLSS
ncbi:hypothetical protein HMSP1_73 [Sinorhizobium phage HMSP1-Susan]|nr:hypothetical protein HMSP1_73 [Sinorhizobium phage HMSP1-Susan]